MVYINVAECTNTLRHFIKFSHIQWECVNVTEHSVYDTHHLYMVIDIYKCQVTFTNITWHLYMHRNIYIFMTMFEFWHIWHPIGDPAQLPAVGRSDLFGTHLWRTFSVLVLREIKRSQDPVLTSVLTKVRMGVCDQEVTDVLRSILQPRDMDNIQLDRTVVICSTRKECDEVNDLCISRIDGRESVYEAL